jgi:hypothetical protein
MELVDDQYFTESMDGGKRGDEPRSPPWLGRRVGATNGCWCRLGEGFNTPAVHVSILARYSYDDGEEAQDLRRYDRAADLWQL